MISTTLAQPSCKKYSFLSLGRQGPPVVPAEWCHPPLLKRIIGLATAAFPWPTDQPQMWPAVVVAGLEPPRFLSVGYLKDRVYRYTSCTFIVLPHTCVPSFVQLRLLEKLIRDETTLFLMLRAERFDRIYSWAFDWMKKMECKKLFWRK